MATIFDNWSQTSNNGYQSKRHVHTDDGDYLECVTLQNNGWKRINIYWEDGTEEELYEKI